MRLRTSVRCGLLSMTSAVLSIIIWGGGGGVAQTKRARLHADPSQKSARTGVVGRAGGSPPP